jgi:nitrate reductase cytochrome c-type subunit
MTFRADEYPSNWPELRAAVQARACDTCERCGVANHSWVRGARGQLVHIVCTTAHLEGTSKMSQDIDDMRFWCQKCHLGYDRMHHLEKQRQNRDRKRGQMELGT